jgi:hypothetical protein
MADANEFPPIWTLRNGDNFRQENLQSKVEARALDLYLSSDATPKRVRITSPSRTQVLQLEDTPRYELSHGPLSAEDEIDAARLVEAAFANGELTIEGRDLIW